MVKLSNLRAIFMLIDYDIPYLTITVKKVECFPKSLPINEHLRNRYYLNFFRLISGEKSSSETVKLFAMPSGASNKAISITEVTFYFFFWTFFWTLVLYSLKPTCYLNYEVLINQIRLKIKVQKLCLTSVEQ